MNAIKNNFLVNPSKTTVTSFIVLWFVFSVLCITDLFTESFFDKNHLNSYFTMIGSAIILLVICFNYFSKNNRMKFTKSTSFLLIIAFAVSGLNLVNPLLGLSDNLSAISTDKQWKFVALLTSSIMSLLLFLAVAITMVVVFLKNYRNKMLL